eukprot:765520-Alexandrium_andersonii.AAC.1
MPRGTWERPRTQAGPPSSTSGHSPASGSVGARAPANAGYQRGSPWKACRCCSGRRWRSGW